MTGMDKAATKTVYHRAWLAVGKARKGDKITIDEAIKRLADLERYPKIRGMPKWLAAIELGKEALKAWDEQRKDITYRPIILLPGETKD